MDRMAQSSADSFGSRARLTVGDRTVEIHRLDALEAETASPACRTR